MTMKKIFFIALLAATSANALEVPVTTDPNRFGDAPYLEGQIKGTGQIRTAPNASADQIDQLPQGIEVIVLQYKGPWDAIMYPNNRECQLDALKKGVYKGKCHVGWILREQVGPLQ